MNPARVDDLKTKVLNFCDASSIKQEKHVNYKSAICTERNSRVGIVTGCGRIQCEGL